VENEVIKKKKDKSLKEIINKIYRTSPVYPDNAVAVNQQISRILIYLFYEEFKKTCTEKSRTA
jgi:hypothetical protein